MGSGAPASRNSADRRSHWSLAQLRAELLAAGPEAILPQNLPDLWLKRLNVAAELAVSGDERDPGYERAFDALVAVVLLGIRGLRQERRLDAPALYVNLRQLWRHMRNYHHALRAECATRSAGMINPLTEFRCVFAHRMEPRGLRPTSIDF